MVVPRNRTDSKVILWNDKNRLRKIRAFLFPKSFLLLLLFLNSGFATIRTWDNGGGDGLWTTAANWTANTLPGSADTVLFDAT